jgi:D-alanyl-D-alanine dipeptidase
MLPMKKSINLFSPMALIPKRIKKYLSIVLMILICFACSKIADDGKSNFVQIHEIIQGVDNDIRYFSEDNFVGAKVDGYMSPIAFITKEAGIALIKVQEELKKDGLGLKVFDAYRPQKGVDHFVRWGSVPEDTITKAKYYPNINKSKVFELGYVAKKSGHSRGSTIDLTIINLESKVELDMGSPWDFFGEISHHNSPLVNDINTANRNKLRTVMLKHGFKEYANEWWHYTLKNEPFPDTYFDFDVK